MNILDKQLCLQLNRNWVPVGQRTIREAVICLCSESNGHKPALALDIEMAKDENGQDVLIYANPVDWDVWITLPVREDDLYIAVSGGRKIRAPLVVIAVNYDKVPMTKPRLSSGNVFARDGGICQYTGEKVGRGSGNLDHVVPRDRGGRDEWSNLVWTSRDLNSRKSNRLNSEIGLKLIRQPKAPPATPISTTIREARHPFWKPFLLSSS